MKSLLLAILLVSFASWTTGQTVSVRGSGGEAVAFANANGRDISIIVLKGTDESGNPITLLRYTIINKTPNPDGTTTFMMGLGQIPEDAFSAQGPSKMSLSVDTSQLVGFENTTCQVVPPPNFQFNCSPSQGGPVQVAWTGNGINSQTETGHSDTTTGPFTEHIDGHGTSTSADVHGTIFGLGFSITGNAFEAFISADHTHTVTMTHN